MREDVENAVRLEVEIAAAVGNDVIFVLIGLDRDAVGGLLEQIDGRRRIEREHARLHRGGKPRVDSSKANTMSTDLAPSAAA